MVRSLGSVQGPRLLRPSAGCLLKVMDMIGKSPAPSLTSTGRTAQHQEGLGYWKSLAGIEMIWETHRGGVHLLGLWMLARLLPEELGSQATPGDGRRVGLCQTPTRIVSSLVRKLGCVKSQVLLENSGLKQEAFTQKSKRLPTAL